MVAADSCCCFDQRCSVAVEVVLELLSSRTIHHPAVVVTASLPFQIVLLLAAAEAATVYFPNFQTNRRPAVAAAGLENQIDFLLVAVVVEQ